MNFLGHLYFSNNDPDLMVANLFGDFIKGNKYLNYSLEIQHGVLLHRRIDHFIDQHDKVKELRRGLYKELPKVAGVAIDLYFDHLLADNWNEYHSAKYEDFLQRFYDHRPFFESELSPEFISFLQKVRDWKWLNHYPTTYGLQKMCVGVSNRISFPNKLDVAPSVFDHHKKEIQKVFEKYMEDAINEFA